MLNVKGRRDQDTSRSYVLASWIVRLAGKHPSEERVFSMPVIDELAETWFLHDETFQRMSV
jgi:hypothetical protein